MADDRVRSEEIYLAELVSVLWKRRMIIISVSVLFTLLSVMVAFLIPPQYMSVSSILLIGSRKVPLMVNPELTGLDVVLKVGLQEENKIKAILESQLLAESVVRELNLVRDILKGKEKHYRYPDKVAAEKLRENIKVIITKDGTIQLKVTWTDPETAYRINQKALEVLERLIKEKDDFSIEYYESQVQKLENELRSINEKILKKQKDNNNPEYISLLDEAQQLKIKYETLVKLLEQARLESLKEKRSFVITSPSYPEKPSSPKRALIISAGALSGLLVGLFVALVAEAVARRKGFSPDGKSS